MAGFHTFIFITLVIGLFVIYPFAIKLKFATEYDCDRHSLDALYHEKYKIVTDDIFTDSTEFVTRVADLIAESMSDVMADLPGRDSSDMEERRMHFTFKEMKRQFTKSVEKMKKNLTSSWESLMAVNFDLLLDNETFTLQDFMNKTLALADTYKYSMSALDKSIEKVISPVKNIVSKGMDGIIAAAQTEMRHKSKKKVQNDTNNAESEKENTDSSATQNNSTSNGEDAVREKMKEIVKLVVPNFLGKINLIVIERKIDLNKEVKLKTEDRDSVLDDVYFDISMMKTRMKAIIHENLPKDKDGRDLARRNIYMYWANLADAMYKQRIEARQKAPSSAPQNKHDKWKDEDDLADTLVTLMEIYP